MICRINARMTALERFFFSKKCHWMGWTCFSDSHVLCKTGCWQDVKKCKELVKTCCLEKNTFEDCLYFKCVHPCSFFFSMTLGFAKSTAKKVYRFPVLYGRSGGPFKEKLWSGCRTPKWSVTGVMTFWLWNFYTWNKLNRGFMESCHHTFFCDQLTNQ